MSEEREIDKEYLASLERKLANLKNPEGKKATAKTFLSDLASYKDHQLFRLITGQDSSQGFEDHFVDAPIQANYLQRKVAPHTVAVNKQELLQLVKNDLLQKLRSEEGKWESEEKKEKEEKSGDNSK